MSVTPKRNLPPQSEVWGRSVDQRLDTIQAQSSRQNQDIGNTLTGVNASLVRLSEQVGEIRTITETLVEQQATLQAQQEQLTTQQTTLTQTVGELQTVVGGMLSPSNRQSQIAGFALTPDSTIIDTVTFDVPSGYTRASVIAMASVSAANATSSATFLYTQIVINGLRYGEGFDQLPANQWASAYVQNSRVVGVTPGGTVNVSNAVRSGSGTFTNTGNSSRLVAQVLFLR